MSKQKLSAPKEKRNDDKYVYDVSTGEMPVPVWDCSGLGLLDEPLDTATVVSDDIWKKFDLDFPLDRVDIHSGMYYERTFDDGVVPDLLYDKMTCLASREIRHHDCMWAGLCISKEHNRTLPAKRDSQIQKKIPAGRSVLISRASAAQTGTSLPVSQQQAQQQCRAKNVESDGESTRPETPQSSSSDTETEDEGPFFRHDQINIHEKLSECMSDVAVTKAVPVSEVTGQLVRFHDRRKEENDESQCQVHRETNIRNTLSDHCYHLNQPINSKNLEHLGVQTPSDSGESRSFIFLLAFNDPTFRRISFTSATNMLTYVASSQWYELNEFAAELISVLLFKLVLRYA